MRNRLPTAPGPQKQRGVVAAGVGAPRRHLALGQGIHFCLGAGLARLETRIAFEEIFKRWPNFRVDISSLSRLPSLWVRAWERVPLELA